MSHPDTPVCVAAVQLARDHSPPFLFNHAIWTFASGGATGALQGAQYDEEVSFLLHR